MEHKYIWYTLVYLSILVLSLTLVSAGQLSQPIKQSEEFDLVQTCNDCTFVELVSVTYPNGTVTEFSENMTKLGEDYTYKFGNTSTLGTYRYHTCGDLLQTSSNSRVITCETITFEVTYGGEALTTDKAILQVALLGLLIFLFLLSLVTYSKLPSKDNVDDEKMIISINKLKYLRPVMLMVAWAFLLAITFIAANIAKAYIPNALFGTTLFSIWRLMLAFTYPMFLFWFIFLFAKAYQDRETKRLIERGVGIQQKF